MVRVVEVREDKVLAAINAEPTRRILAHCITRPKSVKEISDKTGFPLPSTYRHVNGLVEDGLLFVERSAMTNDGKPYDLYRSTLRNIKIEVVADAVTVTWELNTSLDERLNHMWNSLRGSP